MKPLVIYHADCTDGFGAAFAAWLKLGDEVEYQSMQYGKCDFDHEGAFFNLGNPEQGGAMLPVQGREIYILDFSFERSIMKRIFTEAKRVVWLDHHKTAFEMWCDGIPKCGWYEEGDSLLETHNYWIQLNNNKSGALLAWEYFHPNTEAPALIRHIDDRDRWQFKLEGSRELHAVLASYRPWNFQQWQNLFNSFCAVPGHFLTAGKAILRAQEQNITRMLKQVKTCRIIQTKPKPGGEHWESNVLCDVTGLALNAPIHQSEIGHELANASGTFGLVWYLGADNRAKCSLRSNGDYDVSAIARAFGGGGHRNAAGFEIDIQTLMGWLK